MLASESFYFGGICGWNLKGTISSSYSIAKLSTTMYYAVCWIGGVVGREQGQTKDNDNYYLENILLGCRVGDNWTKDFLDKSEELNSSNMKTSNFVTLLNNGQDIWVEDRNNINDGYPILNWQVEN